MNESLQRQEAIFSHALSLPVEERAAYLVQACAGDAELRRKIEELLQAHAGAGSFLGSPPTLALETNPAWRTAGESVGDRIGRYTLIQKLGEGGAGVVYEAQQEEPVRRRVALKLMKPGMDTAAAIARFEAERQALALMEHPHIAQVFDAGSTGGGRLYFVMELVRGVRITDFCDQNRLPTAERLRLFVQVCHAVQHAHQKGVIHRDLKPSNILVTRHDGEPVPKVIDFGIAKATQGRLTDQTLYTALEQLIGTPAYMSPEQATGGGADIDTRSDIYSLGVLLYELLTGRPPFDTQELLRAGVDAMQRAIREREPPRPSTRLRTTGEGDLETIAAQRNAEPPRLIHLVRGDLDWIAMKALEKDRQRRYATASELAADIEHHLADQPVVARPPSTIYLLCKFAARHHTAVAAGATIVAVLAAATGVSAWLAVRARRAEAAARTEAARSAQVSQFLKDMLTGVGPSVALGRDTALLEDLLEKTVRRLDTDLKDQPAVEAELRRTLGGVYGAELHHWAKAETMYRRALALQRQLHPTPHAAVIRALTDLAQLDTLSGRFIESVPLLAEAVSLARQSGGPTHPDLAGALDNLGFSLVFSGDLEQAEAVVREAIAIRRRQPDGGGLGMVSSLASLASVLCRHGDSAEADAALREAMAIARSRDDAEHLGYAARLAQGFGIIYDSRGDEVRAEALHSEWYAIAKKMHGDNHPDVARCLSWIGWVILPQRDYERALEKFREAEAQQRKLLDKNAAFLYYALEGQACALLFLGRPAEAEAPAREANQLLRQKLDPPDTPNSTTFTLAAVLFQSGRRDEAVALIEEATTAGAKSRPNAPVNFFTAIRAFDDWQLREMVHRPTETILKEVAARRRAALGRAHCSVADALTLLGALQYRRGAYADAETTARDALAIRQQEPGSEPRAVAQARFNLAVILRRAGRAAEAEPLLDQALAAGRRNGKEPDLTLLWALNELGRVKTELGHLDEAEALLREGIASAAKIDGARHEDQADACDGLGVILARRGKYLEAEQAFRDAWHYAHFRSLVEESPRDFELPREIAEHLIQLYGDWAKTEPARAAAAGPWKKRLPDLAKVEAALKEPFPLPPGNPQ